MDRCENKTNPIRYFKDKTNSCVRDVKACHSNSQVRGEGE